MNDFSKTETSTGNECHSKIDLGGTLPPQSGLDFYLRTSSPWDSGSPLNDSGFCNEFVSFIPSYAMSGLTFAQDKGTYVDCSGGGISLLVYKNGYVGDLNQFCQNLDIFSPMGYPSDLQSFQNTVITTAANPYNIKVVGDNLFYLTSTKIDQNQPGFLAKATLTYDDQLIDNTLVNTNYIIRKFEVINNKIIFVGYSTSDMYNYKFYEYLPSTGVINPIVLDGTCSGADALNSSNGQIQMSLSCNPNRKFFISNDGSNFSMVGSSNQPIFALSNYESSNDVFFAINWPSLYSIANNVVSEVVNGDSNYVLFKQNGKLFLITKNGSVFSLKKYNSVNSSWANLYSFSSEPSNSSFRLFQGNNFSYMVFERYDSGQNKNIYKTYLINSTSESIELIDTYTYNRNCNSVNLTDPFYFGFVNELNDYLISQQCDNNVVETIAIAPNSGSGNKTIISSSITPFVRDFYDSQYINGIEEFKNRKMNQIVYKNKTYLKSRDSSITKKVRIARIDSSNNLELLPDLCSSHPYIGFSNNVSPLDQNWGSGGFSVYKDNLIFAGNSCQGEVKEFSFELELFKYFTE